MAWARDFNDDGDISSTKEVTDEELLVYLKMFQPNTHSIECRGRLRDRAMELNYITWVPTIFGSNHQYAITEDGKLWRDKVAYYG